MRKIGRTLLQCKSFSFLGMVISVLTMVRYHMFYPQRVVDINDGLPKWTGIKDESELVDESR
jgi:hypothetical protein